MRIGLIVDQQSAYGRRVFEGIRAVLLPHRACQLRIAEATSGPPDWLRADCVDGVIAAVHDRALATALSCLDRPVVNTSHRITCDLPRVGCDDVAIGHSAASFLLVRQVGACAAVERPGRRYAALRSEAFAATLAAVDLPCPRYAWDGADDGEALRAWLCELPRPCTIFVTGAELALQVIHQVQRAGLQVPDQLGVLSGTEDVDVAALSRPALSAVPSHEAGIGEEAARLLLNLIAGGVAPAAPVLLPPGPVIERASSSAEAVGDDEIAAALRHIRGTATTKLGVDAVVAAVGGCRRSLERRFAQVLGRSIYDCIIAARLRVAKDLLRTTVLPLGRVAASSGFTTAQHLCDVFRRWEGMTPGQYRSLSARPRAMEHAPATLVAV